MLEIRGVRRGIYAYDGKCDGTYKHIRDGTRDPIGDVATERGRTLKHALQQHTRCMSAGARAEWACEHMPCGSLLTGETSAPPHASLGGKYANSKGGGNQICWRYEVCAGGYTYDGKCDGTYIHSRDTARVPIGEVAIERERCSKHALQPHTRCMSENQT